MAGVFIDIPGVGNVEAKNAASEATLREILKALKGGGGPGGAGGGGAGGGGGGAGGSGGGAGAAGTALGKTFFLLGKTVGVAVGAVGTMASGATKAAGAAVGLSEAAIGAVEALSKLDGSASGVANIFGSIPLFGAAFKAVAGAADDVVKSYNTVASTGATFGGSISNFAKSASEAGMSMDQFAATIKANAGAMTAFGGTSESGAANFAKVSKQLRTTSNDLYALGYSTQDINNGLAKYGDLLKSQGLQGKKSNAELAQGAKAYLKEMDLLAKATGEERSVIESRMAAMAKDAQFQASMAGLGEDVRKSFLAVTTGMPKELENFSKDIMATGTATTEENQKLMAMMPQSAAMLQQMNAKMQRGEAITLEERNRLNNLMKEEGGKNLKNMKYAGAASAELSGTVNALAATQRINKDSLKEATAEQKKAAEESDKMNKKMQEFQQRISEVANNFKMLLANSGILDVMMKAFEGLVGLANQYLVPAFNLITSVVMKVANGIGLLLAPVIDYISEKFGAKGLGGTVEFIDGILNAVFPVLAGGVRGLILVFDGLWNGVQAIIQPLQELMSNIFGVSDSTTSFGEILIDVGAFVGEVFQYLGKVIGVVIKAIDIFLTPIIHGLVEIFKGLWWGVKKIIDGFALFADMLQDVGTFFDDLFDQILYAIGKLTKGFAGISEDEYKKRQEDRAKLKQEREQERTARDSENKDAAKKQKDGLKQDAKTFSEKKLTHEKLTGAAKKEAEAKEAAVKAQEKLMDYNAGPEELLKQFNAKEGGNLDPNSKKAEAVAALKSVPATAASSADTAKTAIALDAEKKKQEEAKAKEEAEKKSKEEATKAKEESEKKKTTQESAETLLAELNTKMGQLLKINQEQKDINERQLTAAKGMTKNLFA